MKIEDLSTKYPSLKEELQVAHSTLKSLGILDKKMKFCVCLDASEEMDDFFASGKAISICRYLLALAYASGDKYIELFCLMT